MQREKTDKEEADVTDYSSKAALFVQARTAHRSRSPRQLDVQVHPLDRMLVYHRALPQIYLLTAEC